MMLCLSMGEGVVFMFCILLFLFACQLEHVALGFLLLFYCIAYSGILGLHVGHRVNWFDKLSNDDFARYDSFHELGCLLMHDPFSVQIF